MLKAAYQVFKGMIAGLVLLSMPFVGNAATDTSDKTAVTIACDSLGLKKKQCIASVRAWEKKTGLKAHIVEAPTGSSNRLTWVQQQLASESPDIDIYQIDAVWSGLLQNHLMPLDGLIPQKQLDLYHPTLIENNTVNGKLMALPWYVDIGLLIYRKDLLEKHGVSVPQTWEELGAAATLIQEKERAAGNSKIWGYVFSGKAFEGLTCNVNEWIRSFSGQEIITNSGEIVVNTPDSAAILNKISKWIGTITPRGTLNYAEEDSRGVFQSGNAVFVRHWPYVIHLAEAEESPIKGKIGVAPLPKGNTDGQNAGTLGGWQLAISKYTKNKEAARSLIEHLTSKAELKARAKRGGYYPPMLSLYKDPEVASILPSIQVMETALKNAVARPSSQTGLKYNQVSSAIWNTAHQVLLGKKNAEKAIKDLERQLNFMSRKGKAWNKKK